MDALKIASVSADDVLKIASTSQRFVESSWNGAMPLFLVLSMCSMLVYQHATESPYYSRYRIKEFLGTVLLQMMPLVALKMKLWACSDRMSMIPTVLVKTLLMHAAFSVLRIASAACSPSGSLMDLDGFFTLFQLVSAIVVLHMVFQFQFSLAGLQQHGDVRNVVVMCLAAAFGVEALRGASRFSWASFLIGGANLVECLAFLPVVWSLYRADAELHDSSGGAFVSLESKQHAKLFFAFLVGFYLWDDVVNPVRSYSDELQIVQVAHAAHFALVLDFAGFFIFQMSGAAAAKLGVGGEVKGLLEEDDVSDDI